MQTSIASIFALCYLSSSLGRYVLHENGAIVPEDTAEVEAARDLHLQALARAAEREDPLLAEEELNNKELARLLGFGFRGGLGLGGLGFGGGIRLGGLGIGGGFGLGRRGFGGGFRLGGLRGGFRFRG
jgi:hypothetical protein